MAAAAVIDAVAGVDAGGAGGGAKDWWETPSVSRCWARAESGRTR